MVQAAEQDRLVGVRVGNYEVREKFGEGGMGAVYLAEHPLIGKRVALKVLHAELSRNEEVVSRFFNEARAVNDIQHPNIVDIIDFGVLEDHPGGGLVYFIMEYLAGEPLESVIGREAPLAPERAVPIALQIADALAASHRQKIVHRDLKPDNVILLQRARERDVAKVLDFGIAKLTGDGAASSHRTKTGMVLGTPAYMSPEQCEGKGGVDHRTDCYALGVLLYEMLTGTVPFQGDGYGEVLVKHLTQPPAPPSSIVPGLDPGLEAVCLRALEKKPEDRFGSMEEFVEALRDPAGYAAGRAGAAAPGIAYAPTGPRPQTEPPPEQAGAQAAPATPASAHAQPGGSSAAADGARARSSRVGALPLALGGAGVLVVATALGAYAAFGGDDEETEGEVAAVAGDEPDAGSSESAAASESGGDGAEGSGGDEDARDEDSAGEERGAGDEGGDEEPETVFIDIRSSPEGAAIYVGNADEPVGETPHRLEIEESDEEEVFRLEHPGREAHAQPFVPNMARSYDLHLSRASRQQGSRAGSSGHTQTGPQQQEQSQQHEQQVEQEAQTGSGEDESDEVDPDVIPDPFADD